MWFAMGDNKAALVCHLSIIAREPSKHPLFSSITKLKATKIELAAKKKERFREFVTEKKLRRGMF